jgi:FdhE protein
MPDYPALMADWEALLGRRPALAEPLRFWTAILEGWAGWKPPAVLVPLILSPEECRQRWQAGRSLLADSVPEIPAASVEDLLGPVMERLAADEPESVAALQRLAEAWDDGRVDATTLLPGLDRDPAIALQELFGLGSHLGAFLPVAALRPALETYFGGVRELPDGVWARGGCPWCGGAPAYGDLVEDGRRRLSCHVCGGAWIAARLRCPFCESWNSRDLVRLVAEDLDEGYFIEACRACHGYLKGVDRRQRWNAGGPLVEDWGSPHLDLYAAREGYWRSTPSLAHLLPPAGPPGESPA